MGIWEHNGNYIMKGSQGSPRSPDSLLERFPFEFLHSDFDQYENHGCWGVQNHGAKRLGCRLHFPAEYQPENQPWPGQPQFTKAFPSISRYIN